MRVHADVCLCMYCRHSHPFRFMCAWNTNKQLFLSVCYLSNRLSNIFTCVMEDSLCVLMCYEAVVVVVCRRSTLRSTWGSAQPNPNSKLVTDSAGKNRLSHWVCSLSLIGLLLLLQSAFSLQGDSHQFWTMRLHYSCLKCFKEIIIYSSFDCSSSQSFPFCCKMSAPLSPILCLSVLGWPLSLVIFGASLVDAFLSHQINDSGESLFVATCHCTTHTLVWCIHLWRSVIKRGFPHLRDA